MEKLLTQISRFGNFDSVFNAQAGSCKHSGYVVLLPPYFPFKSLEKKKETRPVKSFDYLFSLNVEVMSSIKKV